MATVAGGAPGLGRGAAPPLDEKAGAFGALTLTLTGVGTVIGGGIFVVTGQAAALYAGPGIVISFMIAGAVCFFSGLCYAEMASMIPSSGSAYTFSSLAFGRTPGWMIGWALVAEYLFVTAAVGIGWSAYMQGLVAEAGVRLPAAFAASPFRLEGGAVRPTGALINLPAVAIILAVTASHLVGVRKSLPVNIAIVVFKVSAVALFIAFGLAHAHPGRWSPLIPPLERHPDGSTSFGWPGVLRAAGLVFFAYLGFEALATAGRETRNPRRNVPLALFGTLAISLILYGLVAMAMTGLADFHTLNVDAPISAALGAAGPALTWLKTYVGLAVTIGLWATLWPAIFAMSRLLVCLGEDRHLPKALADVRPANGVPRNALLLAGGTAALVAGFFPVALLGELISAGTLLAFGAVCASVIRLRLKEPGRERRFGAPLWPVTASLGIASVAFLLWGMGWSALFRIAVWQALGAAVLLIGAGLRGHRAGELGGSAL
jgi:APA family basic amino acid/polyamine antiporter